VFVTALVGCADTRHVAGHHPATGIADGELAFDDIAYRCDSSERCEHGRVLDVRAEDVVFWDMLTAPRDRVIPLARLAPGDVMSRRDGQWLVISAIGETISAGGQEFKLEEVTIPTAEAAGLDRRRSRVVIALGAVLTLLSAGLLVLVRWLREVVETLEHRADYRARTAMAAAAATVAAEGEHAVLRCERCATPVALAARPAVACPGCDAEVRLPAEYTSLVASRQAVAAALPREAAALRRARIVGHPLFALVIAGAAYASFEGIAAILRRVIDSGSPWAVDYFLVAHPLMYVPLGLGYVAVCQLFGGRTLMRRAPSLAAVKGERGYACRGCGGPLGATHDGVAELCLYCGVQNLITTGMAAGAASARGVAEALADNVRSASASFWARFWSLWLPVLKLIGVVGVIVYPMVLAVGFAL
jgi:hypothetical protein